MFTEDEALALTLGLLAARRLGLTVAAPAVEGALAKIERVLPLALRERIKAVQETLVFDFTRSGVMPNSDILVTLSAAAQQCRSVWIRYLSYQDEETERAVDLYGLVYRGGFWYGVGYCHLREGIRMFRLDRVLEAEIQDEVYTPPADFDALGYVLRSLAATPTNWPVEVLLETTLEDARRMVPPELANLEEVPDGVVLRCSVGYLDWFAHFLVRLDCGFVVRQPLELKEELRRLAERIGRMVEREG